MVPIEEQLQDALSEAFILRARLDESECLNRNLRSQLQDLLAITRGRSYKLFQRFYAVRELLLPSKSRRERYAATIAHRIESRLRSLACMLRAIRERRYAFPVRTSTNGVAAEIPDSRILSRSVDAMAVVAASIPENQPQDILPGVAFSPLSWNIDAQPGVDDQFLSLFVLSAAARSGSTLVQRICNARKGTLVWGEQSGILTHFAEMYRAFAASAIQWGREREDYFASNEDPNLWIANMSPAIENARQATVHSARTLLNTLYAEFGDSHDMLGFKEVSYGRAEIELLRQCYPQAHFLLLVRHPHRTRNSTPREWYSSFDAWHTAWDSHAREYLELARVDSHCHLLRHEDIVCKESRAMEILGDVAKVSRREISSVLAHKLGSIHAGITDAERQQINERSRDIMRQLDYHE